MARLPWVEAAVQKVFGKGKKAQRMHFQGGVYCAHDFFPLGQQEVESSGSFICFQDDTVTIPKGMQERFDSLPANIPICYYGT